MEFNPVLPGHALFSAQVEQQVGYERFIFLFQSFGGRGEFATTLDMRAKLAAVLQRGIAAFYNTGAMTDPHHCPLPGDLEEFLRPYIQQGMAEKIAVCQLTVCHKAANGDLAGVSVTYTQS